MEHAEIGEVTEVFERTVQIRLSQTEDCDGCSVKSSCHPMSGDSKDKYATALDPFGLKVGQKVKINLEPKKLVKASVIIFVFPLLGLLIGAIVGSFIAEISEYKDYLDIYAVTGGFLGMGSAIIGIRAFNRKFENTHQYYPTVVEIL